MFIGIPVVLSVAASCANHGRAPEIAQLLPGQQAAGSDDSLKVGNNPGG